MDLIRNPGKVKGGLTWADILAEEPFEGQHWEGVYGLPRGSVLNDGEVIEDDTSGSSPSLSPWDDDHDEVDEPLSPWDASPGLDTQSWAETLPPEDISMEAATKRFSRQITLYSHRDEIESLQASQYWRSDWRDNIRTDCAFDIGDPSTLSSSCDAHYSVLLTPTILGQTSPSNGQLTPALSGTR